MELLTPVNCWERVFFKRVVLVQSTMLECRTTHPRIFGLHKRSDGLKREWGTNQVSREEEVDLGSVSRVNEYDKKGY